MILDLKLWKSLNNQKTITGVILCLCLFGVFHIQAQSDLPEGPISTSGTYKVPAGVTGISVEAWGGGGGGGYSNSNGFSTGGGGGGAYAKVFVMPVTPGEVLTIMVGSGGNGSSGTNSGGSSYIRRGSTNLILAVGGNGVPNTSWQGVSGGQASNCIGDVRYSGGNGGSGTTGGACERSAGGGGAGAGRDQNGNNGSNGDNSNDGGAGGIGVSGGGSGGNGGNGVDFDSPGNNGSTYGGGGSGSKGGCASPENRMGGNGARGAVIVTFICSELSITSTSSLLSEVCRNATNITTNLTITGTSSSLPAGTYTITYTINANQYTANTVSVSENAGITTGVISGIVLPTTGDNNIVLTITNIENEVGCNNVITANNTVTIIKKPLPALTLTRASSVICTGNNAPDPGLSSSLPNTLYTITSVASGVTGNTASVAGVTTFPVDNLICPGTTSGNVTYTIIPSVDGCAGDARTYTVTVRPVPTIDITTTGDTNNLCHNQSISLTAETTGDVTWIGWYDSNGQLVENENSQFYPGSVNYMNVTYDPKASEMGTSIKLFARVNNGACGYRADSIHIRVLPLPTAAEFELTAQPVSYQEMCEDTVYVLKVKSTGTGDLNNLKIRLDDKHASQITIKNASAKQPYTAANWTDLPIYESNIEGTTWNLSNSLLSGDSMQIQVIVSAGCNFFSGSSVDFILYSESVCGDHINTAPVTTDNFFTLQDTVQMNTYELSGYFMSDETVIDKITNAISDTVTWRLKAIVKGEQPTNEDKEFIVALVPAGLTPVPGSYTSIRNAPPNESSLDVIVDAYGIEFGIPVLPGVLPEDSIEVEFKFTVTGAPCMEYNFYSEIIFTNTIVCSEDTCSYYSTRGGYYPSLEVERYNFSINDSINGETINGLWYGHSHIQANTEFFAGDSIFIDFYVDRDNSSTLTDGDTLVRRQIYITTDVPPGGFFTDYYDSVYVEQGKQLIGVISGKSLCASLTLPIATLLGQDTLCQLDTTYYYTVAGMQQYKWGVEVPADAVTGATPKRIPLENSNESNYVNESTVRIVWPKWGDYTVYAQYLSNTTPSFEIDRTIIKVHVNQRPVIMLTGNSDTTICEGMQLELSHFFRDTTGIGSLSYYKKETDGTYTLLPNQISPIYVSPLDTTTYRVSGVSGVSGCESLNEVEFTVNVNKMPLIGTIRELTQPACGSSTGSMQLIVSGGSGHYEYSKDKGSTYTDLPLNGTIGGFSAGTYRILVRDRDNLSCTASISEPVVFSNTGNGVYATAQTIDATDCSSNDGIIQLAVNGGTPPYHYEINGGGFIDFPSDGIIGTQFIAGNYDILVSDKNSCIASPGEVVIKAGAGLNLTITQRKAADCNINGLAIINVSGGTEPYTYRLQGSGWGNMNGSTDSLYIAAGSHEIIVKDAGNCETSGSIEISNNATVSISITGTSHASCDGLGGGSITFEASGSGQLYYSIDNKRNLSPAITGTNTISGLPVGVYQLSLFDENGCTATIENIQIEKENNFIQAVNNLVHAYVGQDARGNLLNADYDNNNGDLTVFFIGDPIHGNINASQDGSFAYVAVEGFIGEDSVQYRIQNNCGLESIAWLHIHILDLDVLENHAPVAVNNYYSTKQNQAIPDFDVRINDLDPDGDELSLPEVVSGVSRGNLVQNSGTGTFTYTPDVNFTGVDEFSYKICDPEGLCDTTWVRITVLTDDIYNNHIIAQPDAWTVLRADTLKVTHVLEGVLSNDHYPVGVMPVINIVSFPENGTVTMNADGTFTYLPDWEHYGNDAFSYSLCASDPDIACDTAWVSIFVVERPCQSFAYNDTTACATFNLTNLSLSPLSLSTDNLSLTYYDSNYVELANSIISASGPYYIKGVNDYNCAYVDTVKIDLMGAAGFSVNSERVFTSNLGNHFSITTVPEDAPYSFYVKEGKDYTILSSYESGYTPDPASPDVTYNVLTVPSPQEGAEQQQIEIYFGLSTCRVDSAFVNIWKIPTAISTSEKDTATGLAYNNARVTDVYITNRNNELLVKLSPGDNHLGKIWAGLEVLDPETSVYFVDGESYTYLARRFKVKPENKTIESDSVTVQLYFETTELTDLIDRSMANGNQWDDIEDFSHILCTKYSDADAADMTSLGSYSDPNEAGELVAIANRGTYDASHYFVDLRLKSFSTFYFYGDISATPLPVDLLYFNAECAGNKVTLSWKTATEVNNSHFTVERSTDGYNFTPVGQLQGAGNSATPLSYKLTDDHAANTVTYYRLKQTDFNGAFEYFRMIAIHCEASESASDYILYPNPARDKLYLEFPGNPLPQGEIEVYNNLGMILYRSAINDQIDISHLPAGIYFVKLNTETQLFPIKKIEKQN